MSNRPTPTQGDRLVIDNVVFDADRKPTGYVPKPATFIGARDGAWLGGTEPGPNPMGHFKRFVDFRAFLVGTIIAVVGSLIFQALTSLPFWACFPMVVVAMMLNSWLAEWEDNQPGGFNNPNSDR